MNIFARLITLILLIVCVIASAYAQEPVRKGWWKFDYGADLLKAEAGFGSNLELVGSHQAIAGPEAGNGAVRIGVGSHYKMTHGIAPNGGGAKVNEYTIQIDFRVSSTSIWHTFYQTDVSNFSDGECFINTSGKIGVAATGYSTYAINANEWYRLVITIDNGSRYRYYLDGQHLFEGIVPAIDDRFALENILLLFGDNDGDDAEIDAAEVAIWDSPLSYSQVNALGGYDHEIPQSALQAAGKWKFDNASNPLESDFGKDLELVGSHVQIEGPTSANKAARIGPGSYYKMEHGIAPNGGGSYVNEFTLQMDLRVAELGIWRALFQTNTTNGNDADCFINVDGQIGVGSTGYSTYKVIPTEWYRLMVSVKNGEFFRYYLDGQLLLEGTSQAIDGRYGLENLLLLCADDDGDDGLIDIAEAAIWNSALTSVDILSLGGYGHNISDTTITPNHLVGHWKFDNPADLLKAEQDHGLPLELIGSHTAITGPAEGNGAVRIGVGSHYKVVHGVPPNGEGAKVNEFSLQIDFRVSSIDVWHCFFQTTSANTDDGDCFINTSGQIGVWATGYSTRSIKTNQWYRFVLSADLGSHYNYYLDGKLLHTGTLQSIDSRFSLEPILLLFADEDGEDNEIDVAEVAMWDVPLTADEVKALSGFSVDSLPPAPPANVSALTADFYNLVVWDDVPDEEDEVYYVYASESPVADINSPEVELIGSEIPGGNQSVAHFLYYPLHDHAIQYYYAVTCKDENGNVGQAGASGPVSNTALGVPTISLTVPAGFVADGDITEWTTAGVIPLVLEPSEEKFGHIGTGTFDDNADMTADCYMAVDDNYLYLAFDVLDNVYGYDPSGSSWWEDDAVEIFIGLYNTTKKHTGFQRGAEPDYQMIALADRFIVSQIHFDPPLFELTDDNYEFVNFGASDWAAEVKIPLDSLPTGGAAADARFHPLNGMKITLDFNFHDSDASNTRDGVLNFSTLSSDQSWQGAQFWAYTWVGDTNHISDIDDWDVINVTEYELSQNYPNPFNPATTIQYAIPEAGKVVVEIFDVQGRKISTLANEFQRSGRHKLNFNAESLSSGIYFCKISSGHFNKTIKMMLIR
jgi:hypothetical protein